MTDRVQELESELVACFDRERRLTILNDLGFRYSRTNPQRGLELCAEAQILARDLDNIGALSECLRTAAWCCETQTRYEEAQRYAEESLVLSREHHNPINIGSSLNVLAVIHFGRSQYSEALSSALEAVAVFQQAADQPGLASSYNNLGMIYQELARYPEALESYLTALRLNEERGDRLQAAANIGNVSNVYFYMGDLDLSFEYDERALREAREVGRPYNVAHALESIASHYKQRGQLEEALKCLEEARVIVTELNERRYECAILVKLGSVYELQNDVRRAKAQYSKALSIAQLIGRHDVQVSAHQRLGMLLATQGDYETAIEVLARGLTHAQEWNMPRLCCELHAALAQNYAQVKHYKNAYTHMQRHAVLQNELYGTDRQRTVAEMQARFDVERAERAQEVLSLKNQHLEQLMESRTRELTAMAMRLVQQSSFLQKLRKDVTHLAEKQPSSSELLNTLLSDIVANLRGADEWIRFEQEFQVMHQDFLKTLSQRCPKLTPAELKVCAMLKINLSNKEIANLLSVSLRNVESHRYSIRKKLGLPSSANLTAHFIAL